MLCQFILWQKKIKLYNPICGYHNVPVARKFLFSYLSSFWYLYHLDIKPRKICFIFFYEIIVLMCRDFSLLYRDIHNGYHLGTSSEKYVSFSTKRWWWSSTGSMSSWRVLPYVVIYILHKYYTWISGYGMELHNCSLQIRILSLEVNKLDKHSRRKYHFDLTSFTFE